MTPEAMIENLPTEALLEVDSLPFPKLASGKVRDIFDLGDHLLIVATDRLSAFDIVLPQGIPGRGMVLTQLSLHWFRQIEGLVQHHLVPDHQAALAECLAEHRALIPRSMLVERYDPLPVEAVVRGWLCGSGWESYRRDGTLFGQPLPKGLSLNDRLPEPLFTPTTKATSGHDEALTLEQCRDLLGDALFTQVKTMSLELFEYAAQYADRAGLILADTKFEWGLDADKRLYLIDEALTPDSSRYWLAGDNAGPPRQAYDKQCVRDYLETLDWDKTPPGPVLPADIISKTQARYLEVAKRLLLSA